MINSVKQQYCSFLCTEHGSKIYNDFKQILYSPYDSLVLKLCSDYLVNIILLKDEEVSICDIGGGDGQRISNILLYFHSKYRNKFNLDFIEQSKIYCDTLNAHKNILQNFTCLNIFNDYFEKIEFSNKYDIIFLIHSIFAFDNGNSIKKIISLLNQSGKIVVVANSPHSFLAKLKLIVDNEYIDKRYEINDLEKSLEMLSYNYSTCTFSTEWIIPQSEFKKELEIIFDWISLGEYFKYPNSKKDELFECAHKNSILHNNRYYFREEEVILTIPTID